MQTIEAGRSDAIEVLQIETEPSNWQQSLSQHGTVQWLKPDLRIVTATADEEFHWFVEADRASEHLPVIVRQCQAYETFRTSGRYQAAHGLFPAVLWVVPTPARAAALRGAVAATAAKGGLDAGLFRICTAEEFQAVVTNRAPEGS